MAKKLSFSGIVSGGLGSRVGGAASAMPSGGGFPLQALAGGGQPDALQQSFKTPPMLRRTRLEGRPQAGGVTPEVIARVKGLARRKSRAILA